MSHEEQVLAASLPRPDLPADVPNLVPVSPETKYRAERDQADQRVPDESKRRSVPPKEVMPSDVPAESDRHGPSVDRAGAAKEPADNIGEAGPPAASAPTSAADVDAPDECVRCGQEFWGEHDCATAVADTDAETVRKRLEHVDSIQAFDRILTRLRTAEEGWAERDHERFLMEERAEVAEAERDALQRVIESDVVASMNRLRAENERLREALERSAEALHGLGEYPDHTGQFMLRSGHGPEQTLCENYHCVKARAALKENHR